MVITDHYRDGQIEEAFVLKVSWIIGENFLVQSSLCNLLKKAHDARIIRLTTAGGRLMNEAA